MEQSASSADNHRLFELAESIENFIILFSASTTPYRTCRTVYLTRSTVGIHRVRPPARLKGRNETLNNCISRFIAASPEEQMNSLLRNSPARFVSICFPDKRLRQEIQFRWVIFSCQSLWFRMNAARNNI